MQRTRRQNTLKRARRLGQHVRLHSGLAAIAASAQDETEQINDGTGFFGVDGDTSGASDADGDRPRRGSDGMYRRLRGNSLQEHDLASMDTDQSDDRAGADDGGGDGGGGGGGGGGDAGGGENVLMLTDVTSSCVGQGKPITRGQGWITFEDIHCFAPRSIWKTAMQVARCKLGRPDDVLEAKSKAGKWHKASVVKRTATSVRVHFQGFGSEFDEELPLNSPRLRNIELGGAVPSAGDTDSTDTPAAVSVGRSHILRGVTGVCRAGELFAILGPSGCGKTTLIDCLSGRKTEGEMFGDVWLGGHRRGVGAGPVSKSVRKLNTGYVYQDCILPGGSTVLEYLRFHAELRPRWEEKETGPAFPSQATATPGRGRNYQSYGTRGTPDSAASNAFLTAIPHTSRGRAASVPRCLPTLCCGPKQWLDDRLAMVDEYIVELGLTTSAQRPIGDEFKRGLSGGERRRLCIAAALVANPNVHVKLCFAELIITLFM